MEQQFTCLQANLKEGGEEEEEEAVDGDQR